MSPRKARAFCHLGPLVDFALEADAELFRRTADRDGALVERSAAGTSGVLSIATISPLNLSTISFGVPAGANTPCQELISYPG